MYVYIYIYIYIYIYSAIVLTNQKPLLTLCQRDQQKFKVVPPPIEV